MPNRRHLATVVLALLVGAAVVIVPDIGSGIGSAPPDTAKPAAATERSTAPPEPRRAPRRTPPPPATLVYKVDTSDPVVFLTIDDGTVRDPALITELKRNGIPPTLFLTRTYADQDPAYFRRLRDRTGGSIQNHSATHANLLGRALAAQRAEIGPVSDHYAEVFGERPTLFRAPYGNSDATTLRAAADAGAKYVVHWGSEVRDGQLVFAGPHEFRPGSIVLMHFTQNFRADIAAFVVQAKQDGLTPALLSDYLK
ncbi:polysaccharide deacetylase family protein [Actinophytocola gossypii]|uniref:Polysaccharide deacetylase family protein n=1 Tax=Actinophytocola gossypii TaxID=2812003 RepID=A0ABT2J772_9PSEU|nr:polysaccharide deacetylase family protein [Actinophytocola gossypii]MCT2583701.1 polysaccharide deacetylase family protein [Actinophytocola gossypii]